MRRTIPGPLDYRALAASIKSPVHGTQLELQQLSAAHRSCLAAAGTLAGVVAGAADALLVSEVQRLCGVLGAAAEEIAELCRRVQA